MKEADVTRTSKILFTLNTCCPKWKLNVTILCNGVTMIVETRFKEMQQLTRFTLSKLIHLTFFRSDVVAVRVILALHIFL